MALQNTQLAALIARLDSLPPSVNRYDAVAEMLLSRVVVPCLVGPQRALVYVSICLYGVMFLTSLVYFYVKHPFQIEKWCTAHHGLFRPNASNLVVLFDSCYSALVISNFSIQLWLLKQDRLAHWGIWWALIGIRYLPLFLAGWCYTWGMVVSCVVSSRRAAQSRPPDLVAPSEAERLWLWRRRFLWEAVLINTVGIAAPIIFGSVHLFFFIRVGLYYEAIRLAIAKCVVSLHAAAPSYNPETFDIVFLVPQLSPLSSLPPDIAKMFQSFVRGWMTSAVFMLLLLAVLTPAVLIHLRLLARLRAVRAMTSAKPIPGSKPSSRWLFLFGTLNQCDTLWVTATLVYIAVLIHVPFAIWIVADPGTALRSSRKSALFVTLLLAIPTIVWGVIGNIVHATLLLQHVRDHPFQRLQHSNQHAPAASNGSSTRGWLRDIRITKERVVSSDRMERARTAPEVRMHPINALRQKTAVQWLALFRYR